MEITARLSQKLPVETGQGRNGEWRKQSVIIETEGQYPKLVCLTFFGDKLKYLDNFNPGDLVKISFDAESREYNGKWFTNLNAFYIGHATDVEPLKSDLPNEPMAKQSQQVATPTAHTATPVQDDLPF